MIIKNVVLLTLWRSLHHYTWGTHFWMPQILHLFVRMDFGGGRCDSGGGVGGSNRVSCIFKIRGDTAKLSGFFLKLSRSNLPHIR